MRSQLALAPNHKFYFDQMYTKRVLLVNIWVREIILKINPLIWLKKPMKCFSKNKRLQ